MVEFLLAAWLLCALGTVTLTVVLARRFGNWILYAVFAMLVLISNLMTGKLIQFGGFVVTAVVAVYAVTFLCTDAICELYSKKEAQKVVLGGFLANILALPLIYLVVAWPAASFQAEFAQKFNEVFGFAPRVIIASMVAYLASQTHDVYVYAWYKEKTKGKYMWFRNNASTIVSQFIDTNLFIFLAFYGVLPLPVVLTMVFCEWMVKVGIALLDTPFLYLAVSIAKRIIPQPMGLSPPKIRLP